MNTVSLPVDFSQWTKLSAIYISIFTTIITSFPGYTFQLFSPCTCVKKFIPESWQQGNSCVVFLSPFLSISYCLLHRCSICCILLMYVSHCYQGYHKDDKVIKWFWEVVEAFSNEQKLRLLQVGEPCPMSSARFLLLLLQNSWWLCAQMCCCNISDKQVLSDCA